MIRFLAPPHVSAAFLSSGPAAVIDGVIELANDLSHSERARLIASGFTLAPPLTAKGLKPDPAQQKAD